MIKPLTVHHSVELYRLLLGKELYQNPPAQLWEVVRNHCIGCMEDHANWQADKVRVEIQLMSGWSVPSISWTRRSVVDRTLFIFDSGHGFRDADFERFGIVGRPKGANRDRFGGGSQKNLGRLAPISLNVASEEDPRCGYMIYTRTAESGPVIAMEVTSVGFSEGGLPRREIPADSPELGPYRGHRGSFSLSVIPNCVFESHEEIASQLRWYMPSKRDQAIDVRVAGKKLTAPPLPKASVVHGELEAYLERHTGTDQSGGIWLCDKTNGLRCAFAPAMSQDLPWPLGKESLRGVIFYPGWYSQQNTSRSGFQSDYLRTKVWKGIFATMQLKLVPFATDLLDLEQETFGDSSGFDRAIQGVAEVFARCWGMPIKQGPGVWEVDGGVVIPPGPGAGGGGGGHGGGGSGGARGPTGPNKPRRGSIPINIDGRTYYLGKLRMDDDVFAELAADDRTININPAYSALPSRAGAQAEHIILGILRAVAEDRHHFYANAPKASKLVAQMRNQIKAAAKKPRT